MNEIEDRPSGKVPLSLRVLIVITLVIVIIAPVITDFYNGHKAPMAGAVAVAGLVTFGSVLYYLTSIKNYSIPESVRHTIASTFLIVYLLLVTYNTFFNGCGPNVTNCSAVTGVTSTLLSNFTTLAGVVVAFYFGSITIEKVTENRIKRESENQNASRPNAEGTE